MNWIIITIFFLLILLLIWILYRFTNIINKEEDSSYGPITSLLNNDAHLHRLLMIETISGSESSKYTLSSLLTGINELTQVLVKPFGVAVAQKVGSLLRVKTKILSNYYKYMKEITCGEQGCFHITETSDPTTNDSIRIIRPAFPGITDLTNTDNNIDLTTLTMKQLENTTIDIINTISGSMFLRNLQRSNKGKANLKIENLTRLLNIYDKELINQTKSFASQQYDISMNSINSLKEITTHIANELTKLKE